MAGAGGEEVGRISIRVVPDTDRFREELEAGLKRAEAGLKVEIPVHADTSEFRREVQAAAKNMPDAEIDVEANLDRKFGDRMLADVQSAITRLGRIRDLAVKVRPDLDGFQTRMLAETKALASQIEAKIPLTAEGERFRRQVVAHVAALENTIKAKIPVELELAAGQRAKIVAQIAALRALANIGDDNGGGIKAFTQDIEKAGATVEHTGRQFLGLTRIGWLVTAVFAAAAPVVGLVAGLLAGLPSLMGAFAAGAGAVALGMNGIQKAAEAAGLWDPQGGKKGEGGLGTAFVAIKEAVSGTFQQALTAPFQSLASIIPKITVGMQQVASGVSQMVNGLILAATSGNGLQQIQNILTQTGAFFSGLGPVIQTGMRSFLQFASAGASSFDLLLAPLQNFANQFQAMVERVTNNGVFEGAMQGLSQTLDGLLSLFTRVFESGLEAMGQLGQPIQTLLNGMGDAIVAMMPGLTAFSALIGNVGGTLLSAVAPAIQAVTPAFVSLANTLGAILSSNLQALSPLLTQIASALGTTLTTALAQIQPMLPQLLSTFQQFATTLATQLAPILPQLAQQFGVLLGQVLQLAPSFLQLLTTAIIPMIPQFMQLAQQAMPLAMAMLQLAPSALRVANGFLQLMTTVGPLIGILSGLLSPILNIGTNFDTVKSKVDGFLQVIQTMPSIFGSVMGQVISTVATTGAQIVQTFVRVGSEVLKEVSSWPGKIVSALGNLAGQLASIGASAASAFIGALASGIAAGVSRVAGAVSSVVGAVRNLIPNSPAKEGPLSGSGWQAVKHFGSTLGDALASEIPAQKNRIVALATELMQAIKDVFGSAEGLTLNFNFGGLGGGGGLGGLQAMSSGLNPELSTLNSNLAETRDLTAGLDESLLNMGTRMDEDLKKQADLISMKKDELEIQRQMLQNEKNATEDKERKKALQARIDEINLMKDQLELQREQLAFQDKYGGSVENTSQQTTDYFRKAYDAAKGFVDAQQQQLFSDLGISGNGAIPSLIEQGVAFGEQFIFNVSNVDEAIAVKNNQTNKKALQFKPR